MERENNFNDQDTPIDRLRRALEGQKVLDDMFSEKEKIGNLAGMLALPTMDVRDMKFAVQRARELHLVQMRNTYIRIGQLVREAAEYDFDMTQAMIAEFGYPRR